MPAGFAVAVNLGHGGAVAIIMSVLTGTLGGLMRDVVANEVPMVLRQGELYVTAAFAGAIAGLIAQTALPIGASLIVIGLVTLALRGGSLIFGWQLPVFRSRPPR